MKRSIGRYIEIDESQDYGTVQSNAEDCLYSRTLRMGSKNCNKLTYESEPEVNIDNDEYEKRLLMVFEDGKENKVEVFERYDDNKLYLNVGKI